MSQVVSIRVPEHYEKACAEFRRKASADISNEANSAGSEFMVFYDESFHEIRCEGNFPDSVFSALVKVKEKFGGKLFYEGVEWNKEGDEEVDEAGLMGRIWMVFAIIFFPVTIVYFLFRIVFWIPFKAWKATR